MDRESVVLDVQVQHEGKEYSASYFVEGGMIHANIAGRMLVAPRSRLSPADTVSKLLSGHLMQQSRKRRQADIWKSAVHRAPAH